MPKWLMQLFMRLIEWLAEVFGLRRPKRRRAYAIVVMPPLGGTTSSAHDINDAGVVVGSAQTATGHSHAYSWAAGTIFDLGALVGPDESSAFAINRGGHIGGQFQQPPVGAHTHAFVVPPQTTLAPAHDIGTLGGDNSVVMDLSVDHISVGWADDANGNLHAFVRMISGPMIDLTPGLLGSSSAEAIDSSYNTVGWTTGAAGITAFRWHRNSGLTQIMPPGATFSRGFGILYNGDIAVGEADFGGGAHAVMWDKNNVVTDLGTLGGTTSVAYDINGAGDIVGASLMPGGAQHAFITSAAGPMVDLNTLIPPNSGWILNEARAINAQGQIVGNGTLNGQQRGFLLT